MPTERIETTEHAHGLGLRAQILLALGIAFILSFAALGVIVMQVSHKAQTIERSRRAYATLDVMAATLMAQTDGLTPEASLPQLLGRGDVVGVALERGPDSTLRHGRTAGKPTAQTRLADGSELSLWTTTSLADEAGPLEKLLRLYLLLTFALILATTYVALTRLIVRPVENLTRASERLASTALHTHVPVVGAAELSRLSVSFNRMARDLREERSALVARLAELEHTTRELHTTQDHLIRSEKLASVGRLSAGIAHEIGNPLAAILGLVELLLSGDLEPAEEHEFLQRVKNEVERIHRIIRGLLDYARADTDKISEEQANLVHVVEEAVKLISPQKDLRGITIERRFAAPSALVRGSESELIQLVLNLLLNAADAVGGDGYILIETAEHNAREVLLSVSDSGPGIPLELRDKMFDPFVTSKPPGKGTGLGLSVSQAIAIRSGGNIRAADAPRGARIEVRLLSVSRTSENGSLTA